MTIDTSNPSSVISGVSAPTWGSDTGLSKEEASFQAAMNLGALATQLDRLLKSGDPAAKAEIQRLIGILQSYGDNLDPKVKGWADSLLSKLTDASGNLSLTTANMQAYLNSYRVESSSGKHDDIASQILAWAFPSSGNWPYKPDVNANADTKFAAIRFMTSFYGSNAPDLDGNMEGFFSQGGTFSSFAEEAGIFVSLYLELNADKNIDPKAFHDDIINSLKDKDPAQVDPSFQKFLESVEKEYYTDYIKNTLGMSLEEAMDAIGTLLSAGLGGGTGVYPPGTAPGAATGISTVTLPASKLPPSGSPDGSLPGDHVQWGSGSDLAYDKLLQFAQYFGYVKTNDPTAMFNFANYVIGLSESGILANDPKIQKMLESMGAMSMLQTALRQAMEYAFFTADPPSEAGDKLNAYIAELKNTLGNVQPSNPYIKQMIKTVEAFALEVDTIFIPQHTDAAGNLIWKDPQTGKVYNWTDPKNPGTLGDRFMIQMEIAAEGVPATKQLVSALNGLLRDYRVNTLEELLKEFSDPMFAIVLWLMSYNDKNVQAQQSGENDQEDVMSKIITDHYANGLQGLSASAGHWTGKDVDNLQHLLEDGDAFMSLAPEASGLAANWNENVSGPIENMQMVNLDGTPMVDKNGNPVTLKAYLKDSTVEPGRKLMTLNHMFDTTPPVVKEGETPPSYQANTNYQIFTQATTTGTQLANGQSKNITTALGTLSTLASAILKTMNGIVDNTGVGGMMSQFVKNQRS